MIFFPRPGNNLKAGIVGLPNVNLDLEYQPFAVLIIDLTGREVNVL
jgi:hypothetical protein